MKYPRWSKKYDACISCGTKTIPHKAKGLCTRCYQKIHEYPREICIICNKLSRVHIRIDNKPICKSCYKRPIHKCQICGGHLPSALVLDNEKYICFKCYKELYRLKGICSICGQNNILAVNSDNKKICIKCYTPPNKNCSRCGREVIAPYIVNNVHVCKRCYNAIMRNGLSQIDISKNTYVCNICGAINNVQKVYNDGSIICPNCFNKIEKICCLCKNPTNSIYSHILAYPYCRTCYFKKKVNDYIDAIKIKFHTHYFNILASYFDKKSELMSWESLYQCTQSLNNAFDSLYIKYKIDNCRLSADACLSLMHEYPDKKLLLTDFIFFLSEKEIIEIDKIDSNLIIQLEEQKNLLTKNFARLIDNYKDHLIKKYLIYRSNGWLGDSSRFRYYTIYLYMLTAIRFSFTVTNCGPIKHPSEINNLVIDEYLKLKPYDKGNIKHFIKYINNQKITFIPLKLPNTNYIHRLQVGINDKLQKEIISQCLTNNCLPLRNRLIVLLMLLYGLTPRDIQHLNKENFTLKSNKRTEIQFNYKNIKYQIPQIMASLIKEYIITLSPNNPTFFPGRLYNSPLSLSSLWKIARSFNVTPTQLHYTAINNAMLNGISQPAMLMKMFNIHYITATRYFDLINNLFV